MGTFVSIAKRSLRPIRTIRQSYVRRRNEAARMQDLAGNRQLRFAPPGHFYSPLPALENLPRSTCDAHCGGIQLREQGQCEMLDRMSEFYVDLPFSDGPTAKTRYYYKNNFFGHSDAIVLFGMMRLHRPRKVVEIGSGYSSAVMLDTNELFLNNESQLVFIEPYPARLRSLVRATDAYDLIEKGVQDVALDVFLDLREGDILFVDSSHVTRFGSDVNDILFRVLPALSPGVLIHFHDILWPFEYPFDWVTEGRAWNEAYILRAFLQYNSHFQIVYFNDFMAERHRERIAARMQLMLEETGGSIWLRKTA